MADLLNMERQKDANLRWLPLHMQGVLANSVEDITRNIEHSLEQDYIPFNELVGTKFGAVAVVGSGPSLKKNWQELRDFDGDIVACNASCQFLLEKGIVPQYMMCFDADPLVLEFFTPHPDITYLLASRIPPKVFEILEGCRIVVWHAAGDEKIRDVLEERKRMEPMIVGGSAAVTRAMMLVLPMGYTDMHVYGGDSSFTNGETHIRKSTTEERRMAIKCGDRVFEIAPWMTMQVEDLKLLAPLMKKLKINLHLHGDGLLQYVGKELGFRTDYESAIGQRFRILNRNFMHKARILWQHV